MFIYLIFFILGIYYFYYERKHSYLKKQCGLSGPKPFFSLGNTLDILFDTFANYEKKNFQKYGKTYVDFTLDKNGSIITSDPEHIKKVLIKDFHIFSARVPSVNNIKYVSKAVIFQNEDWKRIRTQISPVFSSGRLKAMVKKFKHPVDNVIEDLNQRIEHDQGNKVEMKKLCKSFALDVIANVVFSLETHSHKDDKFSQKTIKLLRINKKEFFIKIFLPRFISNLKPVKFLNQESIDYFVKLSSSLIEERKENKNIFYNDFIELLLKSEAEAEEVTSNSDESGHINRKLTLEEIIGQCFIFFLAGMETISTALAFFFYELALHEDIQEKLYQDILKNYPDEELNYENLNNSKYLECVLNEVLRCHATLNRIYRKSASDYDFGEFQIKKDQVVGISIYNLHHDPEIYEDPYVFKPERFESQNYSDHHFIAFSDGPRNCIGNRFAMLEMKYLIINVIKRYKILRTDFTQVPIVEEKFINLASFKEMFLGFQKRL
nr:cytochrome p450 4726A1 [Polyphagotarsonemus latus]